MRVMSILFLLGFALACHSRTLDEQVAFIRNALEGVLLVANDDTWALEGRDPDPEGVLKSWEGFLGRANNGWSMEERREAFDRYLESLGTADCQHFPGKDKRLVLAAFSRCRRLAYTNAVPYLKGAILNSNGVYRSSAIVSCIELGPISPETTDFVESIVTNLTSYSRQERGTACGKFSRRLLQEAPADMSSRSVWDGAVRRLYKNRMVDVAGANMLDTLFVSGIEGYEFSSNRLAFAMFVLGHPGCIPQNAEKFSAVTNQLLTSGQPLRQLNIGATISCD